MESMMTARQVAELLGVHENWVYDQAAGGVLPSYKIGGTRRFDPNELRGWIAEHREGMRDHGTRNGTARTVSAPARRAPGRPREPESEPQPSPYKRTARRAGATESGSATQPTLFES
jgi:excisionase family DNA binding protein